MCLDSCYVNIIQNKIENISVSLESSLMLLSSQLVLPPRPQVLLGKAELRIFPSGLQAL